MGIILITYKIITSLSMTMFCLRHFTKLFPYFFFPGPQDNDFSQPCLQLDWHHQQCSPQKNVDRKDVGPAQALS